VTRNKDSSDFLFLACWILRRCRLSRSLFKNQNLIGANVLKRFINAARPLHLSAVNFCGVTETEVQTQIVLRNVAAAAAHLVHLLLAAGKDRDPRSNAIPIRFLAHRFDQHPILFLTAILQQAWSLVHIVDHDLKAAVIVEIADGCAP